MPSVELAKPVRPRSSRCAATIGSAVCSECGTEWQGLLCLDCAKKRKPEGPPLKRLRRYGFAVSYRMRQCLRLAAEISGAIPTACEPKTESLKVSHLYVACDGKSYIGHEWISQGGSSYSWSEPYPPNAELTDDRPGHSVQ